MDSIPLCDKFFISIDTCLFRHRVEYYILCIVILAVLHILPDFIRSESKDWRNHSCHSVKNDINCSLSSTTKLTIALFCIKSILENIKVEVTHIYNTEIVNSMEYLMEFKAFITLTNLIIKLIKLHQSPLINRKELI